MPISPCRPSQTRKEPTETHSPAKGVARKNNQPSKSIDDDDSSVYSSVSADDNYDIMSVEESKDNANTTPTHMSISKFYITYENGDSTGYEPTDEEEDDYNLSDKRCSLSSLDESSSDISSFDEGDVNIPPPPICKTINRENAAQQKTKKLAKNAPILTAEFKGFHTKDSVGYDDISGDDISFIHHMNMKKPIIPISRDALDI